MIVGNYYAMSSWRLGLTTLLIMSFPALAEEVTEHIKVLRADAATGNLEAIHGLGVALQNDDDPTNDVEGRDLLIEASQLGRTGSAFYLAQSYLYGWHLWARRPDGEPDAAEGLRWLRVAGENARAKSEVTDAYRLLGKIYAGTLMRGIPWDLTERNPAEAAKWFLLCADRSDFCAGQLGILLVEEANTVEEGLRWLQIAAAKGEPWSMNKLGSIYVAGNIVSRDYVEALAWYLISAKWTQRVGIQNDIARGSEFEAVQLKKKMSADDIRIAEEKAKAFRPSDP